LNPRPTAWEADALPLSYTRADDILARSCAAGPIVYLGPMKPDEFLTDEERAVVARARAFAEQHVAPHAARWEWDRHYPLATMKLACAAGLDTIELAKQHGGQGLSYSCKLRAFEEIAKADFAFAFALINHHNALVRFARDGRPALVSRLLPRLIAGEVIGCAGLSEPGIGSDFGAIETSAVKVDGGWTLNGAKAWITNAAAAGFCFAYAQTDGAQGTRGMACFAVEADRPGFHRDRPFELHGGHAIGVGGFRLVDYFAPDEALLQAPGQAFKSALAGINGARTYVAAMCCGMLQASLETAVRYTQQRKTFGRKVIEHQGVRWKLVDAATDLEAARLLAYRAARLIDLGGDAVLAAAHAKKFATEMALHRIADCIQAMGANGLRAEYPLARHLACAKIAAYTDGSIEMMNERIGAGLASVFG
jgi:alkylation response protein AidB-like acyl-CoA dehydrogenase